MGPRKFRLAVRKNAERNKYAAASSLKISIPKVKLVALGLTSLKSQLCTALVSSPWTLTASDSESALQKIVICFLDTGREPPVLRLSITIREDFSWAFGVFGQVVDPQLCRALSNTSSFLDCTEKVLQFMSLVEQCKVCIGNNDDKFMEVAKRRDGTFKDHSGKRYR